MNRNKLNLAKNKNNNKITCVNYIIFNILNNDSINPKLSKFYIEVPKYYIYVKNKFEFVICLYNNKDSMKIKFLVFQIIAIIQNK